MAALIAVLGSAQAAEPAGPQASGAWARATVQGAQNGGAYLNIDNKGAADRLVSASSPVAAVVELHSMSMDGGVMRMNKLERGIELPAGQRVELKPGGLHIMLMGLKAPLKEGDKFPLSLRFEKSGEQKVEVSVAAIGAASAPAAGHQHMH